jgi:two-component system chemotaxis response regulator CheY
MNILIAEDDATSRLLLEELLKPYGSCTSAVDGLQAVQVFTKCLDEGKVFDLVCLDIMMPKMDGQSVLKEIRKIEQQHGIGGKDMVKIIMTTALDDAKNIMQAFLRGSCEGYLNKPITTKNLYDKLAELGFSEKDV